MSHYTLKQLVEAVEAFQKKKHGSITRLKKALKNAHKDLENTIYISWHVDDVKEVRKDLTDEQCGQVLDRAEKNHDCNYGLTWDSLSAAANDLFGHAPQDEPDEDDEEDED